MATNRFSRKRVRARKNERNERKNVTEDVTQEARGFREPTRGQRLGKHPRGFFRWPGGMRIDFFPGRRRGSGMEDQLHFRASVSIPRGARARGQRRERRRSGGKISPPCSPLMVVKIDDPGSLDRRHFSRGFKARTEERVAASRGACPRRSRSRPSGVLSSSIRAVPR